MLTTSDRFAACATCFHSLAIAQTSVSSGSGRVVRWISWASLLLTSARISTIIFCSAPIFRLISFEIATSAGCSMLPILSSIAVRACSRWYSTVTSRTTSTVPTR